MKTRQNINITRAISRAFGILLCLFVIHAFFSFQALHQFYPSTDASKMESKVRELSNNAEADASVYQEERNHARARGMQWLILFSVIWILAASAIMAFVVGRTRSMERQLADEKLKLAVTLKSIGDGVLVTDDNGTIIQANPVAETLTGWLEDEAIGQKIIDVFHVINDQTREPVENSVSQVLRTNCKAGLTGQTLLISKDGVERAIADSSVPIWDQNGRLSGVVLVFNNHIEEWAYQKKLLESENKYRLLSDNSLDAIWTIDPEFKFTYVNPAVTQLTGHTPDEWIGSRLSDRFDEKDFDNMMMIVSREMAKGSNSAGAIFEAILNKKNGEQVPVEIHGKLIFDEDNQLIGMQGVTRDISERKYAEESLRVSEKRFSTIFRANPAAITMTELGENRFVDVNEAWQHMSGYTLEEVLGQKISEFNLWVEPARRARLIQKLNQTSVARDTVRIRKKTGEILELLMSAVIIDLAGERYMLTMAQDITELAHARERIEHLNNVLRVIRDVNQLIIHERNPDHLIREGCRLLVDNRGYNSALIVLTDEKQQPVSWGTARIAESSEPLAAMLKQGQLPPCTRQCNALDAIVVIENGNTICSPCPLTSVHGNKNTKTLCAGLLYKDKTFGYLIAALDNSLNVDDEELGLFSEMAGDLAYTLNVLKMDAEHKKSEQKSKTLEKQLLQAQKMESIGRLAGGVAHDYNNMLSVIIGYCELALEKVEQDESLRADILEIFTAAKRSGDITKQLLAFARQQTISPEVLDLNEIVESMLKMLRRLIGEDVELTWRPEADLWPVKIDPTQVDQIMANLCINARDAIDGVGEIHITTENLSFEKTYGVDPEGVVSGNYVMLSVSDNGSGMDIHTLENIFEPFFSTKALGQGTGLGLSTVYGIIKQNDGFINVYSKPAKGSTFKIYLPRYTGDATGLALENNLKIPLSSGETVLLVEDEDAILKLGKRMLESLGYIVFDATVPAKAMDLAQKCENNIDLLITDVVMPEMNGRELAGCLQSYFPDLKVLYMSGYTADVIAHRGVLDEGVSFMQKPFSKRDLAFKVREVLGDGRPLGPQIK